MILFNSIFPKGSPLKDLTVYTEKVKFVNLGDTLLYDTQESIEWLDPYVDVTYKTELKASGETVMPFFDVYLELKRKGFSGKIYKGNTYYDYSIDYSIISGNSAFTLNTSTGAVTCKNNTTTSNRSFQIKVTITLLDSGKVVERLVTFNQEKGVSSTSSSEWYNTGITVYADNTDFDASEHTTKLSTYQNQTRYDHIYWNDILTDTFSETREVLIDATYTSDSSWLSISGDTVSISANKKGSARSGIITATVGEYTDSVTLYLEEDSVSGYSYSLSIDNFSYTNADYTSNSKSYPSGSYIQYYWKDYTSGDYDLIDTIIGNIDDEYCTYSVYSNNSNASLDSTSGVVTWNSSNTGTSNRSIIILITVDRNGLSSTDTAYCYLEYNSYTEEYEYSGTITADYSSPYNACSAAGGTSTLSYSANKSLVRTYASGEKEIISTSTITPTVSGGNSYFKKEGSTVRINANGSTTSRNCTFTLSYNDITLDTVTIYLDGDTIDYYIHDISISANPDTIDASGGSSTITATCDKYTIWVSGDQTGPTSETPSLSKSGSGFTLNGTTLTASKNTSESDRSCTITATCGGESKSITVWQEGLEIITTTEYDCGISASPTTIDPNGGDVTLDYYARYRTVTSNGTTESYGNWTYISNPSNYVSGSATGFNRSGTEVTVEPNTETTSSRSCTYTISYQGLSDSVTIVLSGDEIIETTEYDYEYQCSISSSSIYLVQGGETVTLSPIAQYRRRSRTKKTWKYAGTDAGSSAWSSWSSWTNASSNEYSITGGTSWCTRSGNSVTVLANDTYDSRSCTYTITYLGLSDSVTLTQAGKLQDKTFTLVVNDGLAIGWTIGNSDLYEGMHISDTPMSSFHYGEGGGTYKESDLPMYIYRNWSDGIVELYHRITTYPSSGQVTVNVS